MKNKIFPKVLLTGIFLFMVAIGFAAPTAPVVTPLTTTNQTPTVLGTLTVLAAGETLTVTIGNVAYTVGSGLTLPTTTTWSVTVSSTLSYGTYHVTATVSGPSGSTSDATINELVINYPAIARPTVNNQATTLTTPTITGTATLAAGETFTVSIDGNTPVSVTPSGGNWSYTPGSALSVGSHEVIAKISNGGGSLSDNTYNELVITTAVNGFIEQTTSVGVAKTYSVTANASNTFAWVVYNWDGVTDYNLPDASIYPGGWTAVLAAGADYTKTGATDLTASFGLTWETPAAGRYYVVQVTETSATSCTTIRRIGISVVEFDLLVKTFDIDGTQLVAPTTVCNTNSGGVWTNDDPIDINSATTPALGTMTFTYKVSLYTKKGSTANADLINTKLPTARWRFTPGATILPNPLVSTENITWAITGAPSITMGSPVVVNASTSEVIITATLKNVAALTARAYVLNLAITENTVNVGSDGITFTQGTESGGLNTNAAVQITVNPIPNTSRITAP